MGTHFPIVIFVVIPIYPRGGHISYPMLLGDDRVEQCGEPAIFIAKCITFARNCNYYNAFICTIISTFRNTNQQRNRRCLQRCHHDFPMIWRYKRRHGSARSFSTRSTISNDYIFCRVPYAPQGKQIINTPFDLRRVMMGIFIIWLRWRQRGNGVCCCCCCLLFCMWWPCRANYPISLSLR